jgi:hypothetical protein
VAIRRLEFGLLIAEEMVDQNQSDHGFGHGHSTRSDAGIVSPFDPDFSFFAFLGDGILLAIDGGCGFHHHAHHDIVTVRNAAEDAAGIVGFRRDFFVFSNEDVVAL